MGEIFTFAGLINNSHDFIFLFHVFLVAFLAFALAKLATAKMQLVPSGVQNIMEAYLEGVISMGKDMSRIAKSSPRMWGDIFKQNRGDI